MSLSVIFSTFLEMSRIYTSFPSIFEYWTFNLRQETFHMSRELNFEMRRCVLKNENWCDAGRNALNGIFWD